METMAVEGLSSLRAGVRTTTPGALDGEPIVQVTGLASFSAAIAAGGTAWRGRFPEEPPPDWWNETEPPYSKP